MNDARAQTMEGQEDQFIDYSNFHFRGDPDDVAKRHLTIEE